MVEKEPKREPSFEQAYAALHEATKEVLTGYRERVDFLVKAKNPWTGETRVSFLPLPSASSETAHRAVERLKEELEIDSRHRWHHEGTTFCFPTKNWKIIFSREEIYHVSRGNEDQLIGVVWSLENTGPMNLGQQIYHKGREVFGRIRDAVAGPEQYFQP